MDYKPREDLDESQALILSSLAERVAHQIETSMLLQIHEQANLEGDACSAQVSTGAMSCASIHVLFQSGEELCRCSQPFPVRWMNC